MIDLFKPCVKCGTVDRNKKSGRCRQCAAVRLRAYYEKNIEKMSKRSPPSKEAARAYTAKWRKNNPDYVAKISNKSKEKKIEYVKNNKEKISKYSKKWAENNKDKISIYQKKWKKNNPDKMKDKYRRHAHARRPSSNGGKLSSGLSQRLFKIQKGKCACCGISLKNGFHMDHIVPLALGGKNEDRNIQLLLPACNMKKSAKHPNDYMREMGYLI